MNLFKAEATYTKREKQREIKNVPFKFYVVAEDESEALDKVAEAILTSPKDMNHWTILGKPKSIASNDCGEDNSLLIE
jgi:hypothetical protein